MFPRGVGNLEEVPQDLVLRCIESEVHDDPQHHEQKRSASSSAAAVEEGVDSSARLVLACKALDIAAQEEIGWDFVSPQDWCRAMITCQTIRLTLGGMQEWLGTLGYNLIKHPEGFSPAKLLGILMQDPSFSGEAWRTALLTDRVQEKVKTRASRVNLVAMSSAADSTFFWTSRLKGLLGLPKMPTGPQEMEVRKIVGILVDRGTGAGLPTVMEACLSVEKPNSTVAPLILAVVVEIAPRKSGAEKSIKKVKVVKEANGKRAEYLDHEAIGTILAKSGVASIRTMVMLMGGVAVDELMKAPAKLPKLKGLSIPRSVRRGIVKALSTSSWFALLSVFRFEEFFKNLFKSIHIVQLLADKDGKIKTAPDMAKVYLLQALLRSERYSTQDVYNAKARSQWDKLITAPLSRIAADPLFTVDDEWTASSHQPQLLGKKIPRPRATSVESMLCAHGNRRVTWHAILDCGEITPTQLLRNIVNLALMDFPVDRVKDHLFKSIDRAPMSAILKVSTVLKTILSSGEIAALSEAAQAQASKIAPTPRVSQSSTDANIFEARPNVVSVRRRGQKKSRRCRDGRVTNFGKPFMHPAPPAVKKSKCSHLKMEDLSLAGIMGKETDEVRMTWESGVGDKKGQRHQIQRARTVSTRFGPNSVGNYRDMVRSALSLKMETLVAGYRAPDEGLSEALPQRAVIGVISYTEELSKNVVRSGVPPPLPKYTRVAMWRGEDVCLEQIGAGDVEELVAGITWCESKGSGRTVDLDLSVIVYDAEWKHIAHCSWETPDLRIAGVQHSGDVTSAPYPDGGREVCVINFAELLKGFPNARYIVLVVHSYTSQKWDELEDASVFVADPRARGSGPGCMAVIGAARLTGEATASIGGYLDLAPRQSAADKRAKPVFGIKVVGTYPENNELDKRTPGYAAERRVHFVFTDQEMIISGVVVRKTADQIGTALAKMHASRALSGAQTLAEAAAFQAALVCDKVCVVSATVPDNTNSDHARKAAVVQRLARGAEEGRLLFYERIATALEGAAPAAPAAGRTGVTNYPAEELNSGGKRGNDSVVFFGGDLDDWLEVTRQHLMSKGVALNKKVDKAREQDGEREVTGGGSKLILVNVHSAEQGQATDECGVSRVNGAAAFEELCESVYGHKGKGKMKVGEQG